MEDCNRIDIVHYSVHIIFTDVRYTLFMNDYQYQNTKRMLRSDPSGPTYTFTGYSSRSGMRGALLGKRIIIGSKYKFVTMEVSVIQP